MAQIARCIYHRLSTLTYILGLMPKGDVKGSLQYLIHWIGPLLLRVPTSFRKPHINPHKRLHIVPIYIATFPYIHNKISINCCSGCLVCDSQPPDPQSTYIKWQCIHCVSANIWLHTLESIYSLHLQSQEKMCRCCCKQKWYPWTQDTLCWCRPYAKEYH